MHSFTLDDIEDLVISGRIRLDPTGEYDISYYENYVKENVIIMSELIKDIQSQLALIKDEKTKTRILRWIKDLVESYDENRNRKLRIEYKNSPYSVPTGEGYLKIHKYAKFIEEDFKRLIRSYSHIINFMNNVYENFKVLEEKRDIDSIVLYRIFIATKKSCSSLGIRCPDAFTLYNSITSDPYAEKNELLDMEFEIDEANSLKNDIILTSLPYTVTAPTFTWEGPGKYEVEVAKPRPIVWYNRSYLQNFSIK